MYVLRKPRFKKKKKKAGGGGLLFADCAQGGHLYHDSHSQGA